MDLIIRSTIFIKATCRERERRLVIFLNITSNDNYKLLDSMLVDEDRECAAGD